MKPTTNKLKLLRQELCRHSILDFAKFYFPHYMTNQSGSFHDEICSLLMDISGQHNDGRVAVAAPRGHAKSTLVSFFYVMWSICYEKEKFILILSATAKQAQTLLSDITKALETNTKLLDDFSNVFSEKDDAKTKWAQDEIITKNGIKVMALGAGQDLRGLKKYQDRPTLIILDDVDSAKNTYNAPVREKILNWFTKDVLKAGAKGFNSVAVGTILHPESLLSRLTKQEEFPDWNKKVYKAVIQFSDRKDLWQQWQNILFGRDIYEDETGLKAADKFFEVNKHEMLKDTKVLWPEMENYYKLMKIREIEGTYSFDSEKQNDPANAKDSRYDPDKFSYWDDQFDNVDQLLSSFGGEYSFIAACDPSVGNINNTRGDHSAIIVLAKHKGKLYVIDADIAQRSQDDLVQAIINFCKIRRPMEKFIIEANLFPELLVKYVRERAMQEGVLAPFKEIRNTKNKELRIFGMETYITTGIILFSRRHQILLDQLKYFPRDAHDDGPDALEMALRGAEIGNISFEGLTEKKDRHGRGPNHPDYEQTTPEEDTRDDDDDDPPTTGIVSLT
jgi:predicted phage terminase large subunit-like protein